jgi:hypothetical protein
MFVLSEYIFYLIFFYIRRAILTKTNPKSGLGERKTPNIFKNLDVTFQDEYKYLFFKVITFIKKLLF